MQNDIVPSDLNQVVKGSNPEWQWSTFHCDKKVLAYSMLFLVIHGYIYIPHQ